MLVFGYDVLNYNLSETFGEVTWKYKIDELMNKLHNSLNKLINKGYSETVNLLSELLETLKTIEDCTSCKDNTGKFNLDKFYEEINKIENHLAELEKVKGEWEKKKIICELNDELFETDNKLNKDILCESCKKDVKRLTDKYGNKEIARFLCQCKLNAEYYGYRYIRWIPFNEFKNIEYLIKGGLGEVYKAIWVNSYYDRVYMKYGDQEVVLERIHNSNDKIVNILKEVKQEFIVIITITLKQK